MRSEVHIGTAAKRLGVTATHLRTLEKKGLIPPARRDVNGQIYSELDRLHYRSKEALEPELLNELREYKQEVIQILREDEEMRRTGIVESERQVFDLAWNFFNLSDTEGRRKREDRGRHE